MSEKLDHPMARTQVGLNNSKNPPKQTTKTTKQLQITSSSTTSDPVEEKEQMDLWFDNYFE